MKKLFIALLALMPIMALAQDENPPLVKDFYKGIHGIPESFVLNDHVNIMQVDLDDENFEITAVNDQMQALWQTKLPGYVIASGKFKGKIYAVACTEYSRVKKNNNTFRGYLLDPATGKVLVDKMLFDGKKDYFTFPYVFDGDGNFLKLAVRQSAFERRLHVAMPSLLGAISVNSYEKQYNQTTDFDVIEFDDKLEPVHKFKPVFTTGTFIGMSCSKEGDTFIGWYDNGNVSVVKYDEGKATPSNPMLGNVLLDKEILDSFGIDIIIQACESNPNAAYYAVAFRNKEKETELGIGKLDFSTGKTQYVSEVFSKDHVKEIKKSFVPVNKKLNSVDLGSLRGLNVRSFYQKDGKLMIALTSTSFSSSTIGSGTWVNENNILINCYDPDLKFKFQQVIPTAYAVPERRLPVGFHFDKDKLYVLSNDKTGMTTITGTYSCIDLASGKCDKMYWLSKKKIGNGDAAASGSVLWFANGFVVPYLDLRGFSGGKYDITLQQNSY